MLGSRWHGKRSAGSRRGTHYACRFRRCPGSADTGLDPAAGAGRPGRGRTWVNETYGVKHAQEWLGHSDPATTLGHYVRLTTAARAKAVAGLDEVTRAALEAAEAQSVEDDRPTRGRVVSLASRR